MQFKGYRHARYRRVMVGVLGACLVGVAATPAHAEDIRSQQWHLDAMHAGEMWKVSRGEGVTVAVIDTGVDSSLPDLKGRVLPGKDFSGLPGGPHKDYSDHGTGMAALIAATGKAGSEKGSYGLAPGAKILPLRIDAKTDDAGNQAEVDEQFATSISAAIRYAATSEAKILNIAMATDVSSRKVENAIEYALAKGKIIFAGVGNSGKDGNPVLYPAATPGVIGVSAIDKKVVATDESQHGSQVDLAAPGAEMVAACLGDTGVCKTHGTSDATAIASASAALIWSKHPNWTANQVTRVLVNTASKPKGKFESNDYTGYGVVRPRIALKNPGDPGDPKTNPLPGPYNEDDAKKKAKGKDAQAAPAADNGDGGLSTGEGIGYGLAAAVVLGAAIATPLIIRRRVVATGYQQPPAQAWPTTPPPQNHPNDQHQH
jgi:type VII secretion-associated serine protease mycosin